jgi:hypothetical protein
MQEVIYIREQLVQSPKQLLHMLFGDYEKVAKLMEALQEETSQYFKTPSQLIAAYKSAVALQGLHTLKPWYGLDFSILCKKWVRYGRLWLNPSTLLFIWSDFTTFKNGIYNHESTI